MKAYRREVMDALPNRPDWHRYMVVMAAADGFSVSEIPVPLYPRNAGQSKFGIGRIPVGALDMLAETRAAALLSPGLPEEDVLRCATLGSAATLGLAASIGSLEPGKRADVVLWDVQDYREIPYFFGVNHIARVWSGGV